MRKSLKAFGISLGLAVLMMVGTITAYAEESAPIVQEEITQQSNDALNELLDELEEKGVPSENVFVNGTTVAVVKEGTFSPMLRGLLNRQVIVELWDMTNSRIWIGDVEVNLLGVFDGSYIAITGVSVANRAGNPVTPQLKIIGDSIGYNNTSKAIVVIDYTYRTDRGGNAVGKIELNIAGNGTVTIFK